MELLKPWWCSMMFQLTRKISTQTQVKSLTVHNSFQCFLQMSICPLEVLIVITAPKRAIVH